MVQFNRRNKRLQLTKLRDALLEVEKDLWNYEGYAVDPVDRLNFFKHMEKARKRIDKAMELLK